MSKIKIDSRAQFEPWAKDMLRHFWDNKKEIIRKAEEDHWYLEYPDYLGLPKKISRQLSSDLVDALQAQLTDCLSENRTFKSFVKDLSETLDDLYGGYDLGWVKKNKYDLDWC